MVQASDIKAAQERVGELLAIVRENRKDPLSAPELARMIGVVPETVKKIERGRTFPQHPLQTRVRFGPARRMDRRGDIRHRRGQSSAGTLLAYRRASRGRGLGKRMGTGQNSSPSPLRQLPTNDL